MDDDLSNLISLLQLAFSGERAAGYAYRGHSRSVSLAEERDRIALIEKEEWHHRLLVGQILLELGASPSRIREIRAALIGRTLGLLCHLSGWLLPMYGAGRLESRNIREYETAARFAWASGRLQYVECLLTMAEVEWEHELYFRLKVRSHALGHWLPLWKEPPPKTTIRESFKSEMEAKLPATGLEITQDTQA